MKTTKEGIMRFILCLLVISTAAAYAYADKLQFIDGTGDKKMSFSKIYINDKYMGRTDKYGRITVELPNGDYACKIISRTREMSAVIVIDGNDQLKKINIAEP